MNDSTRPEGIERRHIHNHHGSLRTRLIAFGGLVVLLVAAVLGAFGNTEVRRGEGGGVAFSVEGPDRIRSGEYFEMLFTIETTQEIHDAVLRVDADVWHDVTINTMIPAPTGGGFEDGFFEFHFGALRSGSRLLVKVDGQINPGYPPEVNEGVIAVADAATTLATLDYSMTVFP